MIQRKAMGIIREAHLHMPLPMGIGRNISIGIIQVVRSITTMDGKYTFISKATTGNLVLPYPVSFVSAWVIQ